MFFHVPPATLASFDIFILPPPVSFISLVIEGFVLRL